MDVKERLAMRYSGSLASIDAVPGPPGSAMIGNGPLKERRCYLRWPVFWRGRLSDGSHASDCLFLDFSPAGAKVRCHSPQAFGDRVDIEFPGAIALVGKLAWQQGCLLGIEFREEAKESALVLEDSVTEQAQAS